MAQAVIQELLTPKVRGGHVIVKTKAVAINPTDWKAIHRENEKSIGTKSGCDFAERIAGLSRRAKVLDKEDGSFGEYITVQADVQFHNPLSDEEGASLGVSVFTALQLPTNPVSTPTPILIYGGSTASGLWGIQFAKLSGYKVITTASPRNFNYLKSLRANVVFNYNSPTVIEDIITAANGELTYVWNCISEGESIYGTPFERGSYKEGQPEDNEFAKHFRDISEKLIQEGKVKPPKIELNCGGSGLEGI
ncbi:GroES-like protein [Trichoderma evansii]